MPRRELLPLFAATRCPGKNLNRMGRDGTLRTQVETIFASGGVATA